MGIQHPEQRIGNLGKLIIDLEVDPRGKKCEGLDETFDVRVLAFVGFEQEPASHLGIGLSEFLTQLPEDRELPLVVFEQRLLH